MKEFLITTLGCKVNTYESQAIREILINNGFIESDNPDFVIVNTCAVTSMAEHKSRQKVSSLKKKYQNSKIIVTGCSSNIHPESFLSLDGVIIVLGNNNHEEILNVLNEYLISNKKIYLNDKDFRNRKYQNLKITSFEEKVRAFVKISDGCNNFCSYCIIPLSRGNLRSRKKEEIICEIKTLINNGYQEIVITGIDSASYGNDLKNINFNDLLEEICQIEGLKRLRISSIEASQLDDRFISLMKNNHCIVPHLHIPLQSGSDTVLKRMNRKYNCEEFYQKISLIRKEIPLIALACDVIVGFPGETETEFNETYEFIKKCDFNFLHVFPYSIREGTVASKSKNQIPNNIKKLRVNKLIELGKYLTSSYQDKFIDQELTFLIESYSSKTDTYHGLSGNYLEIDIKSEENIINKFVVTKYKKSID